MKKLIIFICLMMVTNTNAKECCDSLEIDSIHNNYHVKGVAKDGIFYKSFYSALNYALDSHKTENLRVMALEWFENHKCHLCDIEIQDLGIKGYKELCRLRYEKWLKSREYKKYSKEMEERDKRYKKSVKLREKEEKENQLKLEKKIKEYLRK